VIPDIHENVAWAARVLAAEKIAGADFVVFLGDYFDTTMKHHERVGKRPTCEWLLKVREEWRGKCVFLLGNHDLHYLEARPDCLGHHQPRRRQYYRCSGFTAGGAHNVAKGLPVEFWDEARLFVCVNGYLLSHAGVARRFWREAATVAESLDALQRNCDEAIQTIRHLPHRLLTCGAARGGDAPVGGITWLDWDKEFTDDLPLGQIVGHTGSDAGARQKGRSWCIDGHQTCHGLLTPSGFQIVYPKKQ